MMQEKKHLKEGSVKPPLKQGSQRIYIMRFCPFAQRSVLVAEAKRIAYDTVNVDLTHKPDWFLKLNPQGQVPTLEFEDGTSLTESLIVCDYLNEQFPSRPLYPTDALQKARDRLLIEHFGAVALQMFKLYTALGKKDENVSPFDIILEKLETYDKEIERRCSKFFAGDSPGMVDYMIWPWFERAGILPQLGGSRFDIFDNGRFPRLNKWSLLMAEDDAVKKWFLPAEVHTHYFESHLTGNPDFDYLVK